MILENETKLNFNDVLIVPKRSTLKSRSEINLFRSFKFRWSPNIWEGVPIMASNMDTVGTFEMAKKLRNYFMPTVVHKHYDIKEWKGKGDIDPNFLIPSLGAQDEDLLKFKEINKLYSKNPLPFLCIDVANGYGEYLADYIARVRNEFPHTILIAGNVVTREMTEQLILSGADIVKVGIGSGSACSTTDITGVGYPQFSAIIECADGAHGLGGHIISDGGCRKVGDIAKAFGAGADFVMLGGMLAGHDESGGELIKKDYKSFKKFYGMSSEVANDKYNGGLKEYRASEGKVLEVPYKGPVEDTIREILGGIRSTCTYIGAKNIKEMPKRATFIKVNSHNYQ